MQYPIDDLLPNSRAQTIKALLLGARPAPWWARVIEIAQAALFGSTLWFWRER